MPVPETPGQYTPEGAREEGIKSTDSAQVGRGALANGDLHGTKPASS